MNRQPAVSPDGTHIAFSSFRDGNFSIYIIEVDGQGLRRLTYSSSNDSEPAWSPDGSKIAFVRGYDGTDGGYANLSSCGSEIYVVSVLNPMASSNEGGREESLTRGQGGTDPAWSPDGTRIAFSSSRDGNYEIYTMEPDGYGVERLTYTDEAEAEPAWSPDGRQIAYAAHLVRGYYSCGWMGTPIPPPPSSIHGWMGTPLPPGSIEPDEEPPGIYVMSSGGKQWKASGNDAMTDPTWSPDGSRIAFVSVLSGDGQLYVVDADGGNRIQLTSDTASKSSPSWSRPGITE
jgi:Tol biopolymer transport system component